MLNTNAEKKLDTIKPPTKCAANKIINALITNKNKPSVTIVAGNVKKIKSGRTNMFKTAIANATQIAVTESAISTPGKIAANTKTATAVNNTFRRKFIF